MSARNIKPPARRLKLTQAMIAWTPPDMVQEPTAGEVMVGPWPDTTGWSEPFFMTGGACQLGRNRLKKHERLVLLFIDFHTLVVGDGIDPRKAHRAFLAIDEYRQHISPDIGLSGGAA